MTKIMVVDDDHDATALFEEVLKAEGYEPILLNESAKALQVAKDEKPDLFILDLMMPDPDGFKLCRTLRTYSNFMSTPILIVTALDDKDSKVVAYGAGADDYLTKPFHIEELAHRILDLLNGAK